MKLIDLGSMGRSRYTDVNGRESLSDYYDVHGPEQSQIVGGASTSPCSFINLGLSSPSTFRPQYVPTEVA